MKNGIRLVIGIGIPVLLLGGCINPTKPEIAAIDPSLPFNQAMDAAIKKDEFLTNTLRPGFDRAADGAVESYTVSRDEDGSVTIDHLALLTKKWCAQNGGKPESFSEIAVLQRGVGNVVQQRQNLPVVGKAYSMVCYRGKEALAGAAIGRTTYFLNAAQFRQAMRDAGASIVEMNRGR